MTFDPYKTLHMELDRAIVEYGIHSLEAKEADKSLWETLRLRNAPHIGSCSGGTGKSDWCKNCSCSRAPAIYAHFEYTRGLRVVTKDRRKQEGQGWITADDGNDYERLARALTPVNVCSICFRNNLSGSATSADGTLQAPRPKTRKALYVYLHECAHFVLHNPVHAIINSEGRKRKRRSWEYEPGHPKYIWEYQAEMWAHEAMRKYGVTVSKEITAEAKAYVRRRLNEAVRGGLLEIDPEISRWCGWNGWRQGKFVRRKADAPQFVPVPEVQLHDLGKRPNSSKETLISVMKTPVSGADEAATMSIPSGCGRQPLAGVECGSISGGIDDASSHALSLYQSSVAIPSERGVETTVPRSGVGSGQADI